MGERIPVKAKKPEKWKSQTDAKRQENGITSAANTTKKG